MNKKMIALAIIPIVGLIFIISSPESNIQDLPSDDADKTSTPVAVESISVDIESSQFTIQDCSGSAKCIIGTVTKIIDGDTIHVDDQSVRFALASAPELKGFGGMESRNFIQTICPVGSKVLVDEDDGQPPEGHSRIIGIVHCNGMILNKELLDADLGYLSTRFCDSSEFASYSWAQKHGCEGILGSEQTTKPISDKESQCDASYPNTCIPSPPPDLDCKEIPYRSFVVLPPDPHGFDGDKDGTGCEEE